VTTLEEAVYYAWLGWGHADMRNTVCSRCDQFRVCRSNGRRWLCLECFDQR
jgi:phage gp37-like protein